VSTSARFLPWDGRRAVNCDHIGCANPIVLHVELSTPGSEYAAEADLCEAHLSALEEQGRAFLVALGVIAPLTITERNVQTAAQEHLDASVPLAEEET